MYVHYVAVIGRMRITSVFADSLEQARDEVRRQLSKNAQRMEILKQWEATGAAIVVESVEYN